MDFLNTAWHTLWAYAALHKVIATVTALIVLYGGWYAYGSFTAPSTATRYITTTIATGTIVATMSETGQVSASSNIDVQSKSGGEVLSLAVTAGQHVGAGAALAYIDPTTAEQAVRSATQSLQSAQISLATSQGSLVQTRAAGYNDISAAFLNLPSVMTGLDSVLHDYTVPGHTYQMNAVAYSTIAQSYGVDTDTARLLAESTYQKASVSYTKALADFRATPRTADNTTIDALINESYRAVSDLSDALRASTNFLDAVNTALAGQNLPIPSILTSHISTLTGYTATTNGYVTPLSNDVANLTSNTQGLADSGTDPLSIQSSKLSLQMKQDALAQAQQTLADTVVRAPFGGTVGKLGVQQYQTIGSGTAVATLVSDNQSVTISVNEVDAAKLKVGEKATITFDALPNVSIAGTVSSVNSIGIVASGVVSYSATITFDTPNTSVKPGMSATTDIITGMETGLVVPSSAVKISNGQSYVMTFNPPLPAVAIAQAGASGITSTVAPTRITVTTGLTDNSNVIIESGISAGVQVVTQTITGTTAATASSAAKSTSIFGGAGGARSGGGAIRIGG